MLLAFLLACQNDAPLSSACTLERNTLSCEHETLVFNDGRLDREVHFQVPDTEPPEAGFPVAILFQGSLAPAEYFWKASRATLKGGFYQVQVTDFLLDAGFAVLTPEARWEGRTAWQTNLPGCSWNWEGCGDDTLMLEIFDAIEAGDFGPLDINDKVALGISSGGYMASRMALSYPGEFRRLAIVSASWATCVGAACILPKELPEDHPPTLFLHGALDRTVPVWTMLLYANKLEKQGIEVEKHVRFAGHRWGDEAPGQIRDWMLQSD